MNRTVKCVLIVAMASALGACGRPDTDVSKSPSYAFSSFAGTVWKTKVPMVIGDVTQYNGKHALYLLPPAAFDPKHPNYSPADDWQRVSEVPAGTRVRIERLMQDRGNWGGVRVWALLNDGTERDVVLDETLLAPNYYVGRGSRAKTWDVAPDLLEKY